MSERVGWLGGLRPRRSRRKIQRLVQLLRELAVERLRRAPVLRRPVARLLAPPRVLLLRVLDARERARDAFVRRFVAAVVRRPPRRLLEFEPICVF